MLWSFFSAQVHAVEIWLVKTSLNHIIFRVQTHETQFLHGLDDFGESTNLQVNWVYCAPGKPKLIWKKANERAATQEKYWISGSLCLDRIGPIANTNCQSQPTFAKPFMLSPGIKEEMSHQVFCGLRFRDCKSQYVYVIYVHLSSLLCYTLRGPQNFFKPCKLIRPLVTQIKFKVPVPYPLADPLTSPHGVAEIPHQSQQCQSSPWPSRDAFTMACRQKIPRFLISENNIFVIDKKALYASIYTLKGFLFYQI